MTAEKRKPVVYFMSNSDVFYFDGVAVKKLNETIEFSEMQNPFSWETK